MNNMWGWSFKSKPSPLLVRGRVLLETAKKRQGLKDIAGHPYSLFSCEEALGVRQHVIFKNKATLLLFLWRHNVYDMLSLADWFGFYLFYSRWEMQFLLHWAGLWVWASDKPWLLPRRLRWHQDLYPMWSSCWHFLLHTLSHALYETNFVYLYNNIHTAFLETVSENSCVLCCSKSSTQHRFYFVP